MEGNNNNGGNYNRQNNNNNQNVPVAKKGITMRDIAVAGVSATVGGLITWGVTAIIRGIKNKKAKKAESEKKDEKK